MVPSLFSDFFPMYIVRVHYKTVRSYEMCRIDVNGYSGMLWEYKKTCFFHLRFQINFGIAPPPKKKIKNVIFLCTYSYMQRQKYIFSTMCASKRVWNNSNHLFVKHYIHIYPSLHKQLIRSIPNPRTHCTKKTNISVVTHMNI